MLLEIVLVIVAAIALLLIFAAFKSKTIHIQRSARINAGPDKIYPHLMDFHRWADWSPYEKLDPAMKKAFSGPASGVGSVYEWDGNGKAGAGRMEILESSPRKVVFSLKFERPFRNDTRGAFHLEPAGTETDVTWAMDGPQPYMARVMGVVMNMDKMIGKDFETGLATLRTLAEK